MIKLFILLNLFKIIINLTEEYLRNNDPYFYEKIKSRFELDFYFANSLREISDCFKENPPKKKIFHDNLSAYVLIRDLEVKRIDPDDFEEDDIVSFLLMDKGFTFPVFEIKDQTSKRLAYWMAGNSFDYKISQKEYGFNKENVITIPRTILKYNYNNENGYFIIKSFKLDRKPSRKKKSLKERILELIPNSPNLELGLEN